MRLSINEIVVPPPAKEMGSLDGGWSKVFVHLKDEDLNVYPGVEITTHVPHDQNQTFLEVRKLALERAKEVLRAALEALDRTSIEALDAEKARERAAAPVFK